MHGRLLRRVSLADLRGRPLQSSLRTQVRMRAVRSGAAVCGRFMQGVLLAGLHGRPLQVPLRYVLQVRAGGQAGRSARHRRRSQKVTLAIIDFKSGS